MNAYGVVSLFTGARTEELRALTWSRVKLDGNPPTIDLWRSVRAHGDTKTSKSRHTLELPARWLEALTKHRDLVEKQSAESGRQLEEFDLVFSTTTGSPLDPANVRRAFRRVVAAAGMDPMSWTPRELRHSFVSLLSSSGMPIDDIAHLVGHANTRGTELVYLCGWEGLINASTKAGTAHLRRAGRMHHLGVGAKHAGSAVTISSTPTPSP